MPPEISADSDVADIYEQYEQQIQQFKEVHKSVESLSFKMFPPFYDPWLYSSLLQGV